MIRWAEYSFRDDWKESAERYMDVVKMRNWAFRTSPRNEDATIWPQYLNWLEEKNYETI